MLIAVSLFFDFVQFEFTHSIGPNAGRYVVRPEGSGSSAEEEYETGDGDNLLFHDNEGRRNVTGITRATGGADVLVISVIEAEPAKFGWGRSKKIREVVDGSDPGGVPLLLATYIFGVSPIEGESTARDQWQHLSVDIEEQDRRIERALRAVNRAVRAYRVASGDPYVLEVGRRDARVVRLGYGDTNAVGEGRWSGAFAVPLPNVGRTNRADRMRPGETTGKILSGRAEVLEAEDLLLRTMIDLDHDRTRAAAMQAYGALELLRHELPEPAYIARETRSVASLADEARDLAAVAAGGSLDGTQVEQLERLLEDAELQINRWRYPPA